LLLLAFTSLTIFNSIFDFGAIFFAILKKYSKTFA